MNTEEVLFHKFAGYDYTVYRNRVEIKRPGILAAKKDIIPIKTIASLETRGMMGELVIIDTGGREHSCKGIAHKDAEQMRDVILGLMVV